MNQANPSNQAPLNSPAKLSRTFIDNKRLWALILFLITATVVFTGGTATIFLYQTAFENTEERLRETVSSQAE